MPWQMEANDETFIRTLRTTGNKQKPDSSYTSRRNCTCSYAAGLATAFVKEKKDALRSDEIDGHSCEDTTNTFCCPNAIYCALQNPFFQQTRSPKRTSGTSSCSSL